jgi:hypothetical protein
MVSTTGSVLALWRYPVKSMQGVEVDSIDVGTACIEGDRRWALVDVASGRVLSAKRTQELLQASATGDSIVLPDGTRVPLDSRADELLSAWLGRPVTLRAAASSEDLSYQMTFDPPDDNAEFYDIPIPPGTFLDLSPVHTWSPRPPFTDAPICDLTWIGTSAASDPTSSSPSTVTRSSKIDGRDASCAWETSSYRSPNRRCGAPCPCGASPEWVRPNPDSSANLSFFRRSAR